MRTTVELSDEHRAQLSALAAERGARGFSELVREAIEHYLADNAARRGRVDSALAVLGSLSEDEGAEMEESLRRVRGSWR